MKNPLRLARNLVHAVFDADYRFQVFIYKGMAHLIPDKKYLIRQYKMMMGLDLNLENPQRFTEKIQWLKLYNRRPEYTSMADKYAVKKIVADRIGEEYVIPLIGVWDNPDEIDFEKLPDKFVMKSTHESGSSMSICRDKSHFDFEKAKEKLKKVLPLNYFWGYREWAYKNIPPRVIIEQYMQDGDNPNLPVYKFFTFNGEPKII